MGAIGGVQTDRGAGKRDTNFFLALLRCVETKSEDGTR
jgi:hypothetical protein